MNDAEKESQTLKVTLNLGHAMNYHSHQYRDEVWIVISGEGEANLDGEIQKISVGDVLKMKRGLFHRWTMFVVKNKSREGSGEK